LFITILTGAATVTDDMDNIAIQWEKDTDEKDEIITFIDDEDSGFTWPKTSKMWQ